MKELKIIKLDDLKIMAKKGEGLVFNPSVEQYIINVIEMYNALGDYIDDMKEVIGKTGQSIHPNFKGVQGDRVRCIYRQYGAKYTYSDTDKAKPFLEEQVKYKVDTKLVDSYLKEVGELPEGIKPTDREPQLTISIKDEQA